LSSGAEGTVVEVGLFLCRLVQVDGIYISLPNSVVWNATITNYSRNVTRRLDIPVTVHYDDNLDEALAQLNRLVANHAMVQKDPAPLIKVSEYKDNGTVVNVRVWCAAAQYWDLRWDLFHQIRLTLGAAGFKPPIPVRQIQGQPKDAAPLA